MARSLTIALGAAGGYVSDGYTLGVVGIALAVAPSLHLDDTWLGLIGAGSLAGLIFGAFFTGPLVDLYGRRVIFAHNMTAVAIVSVAQAFARNPAELLALRVVLGLLLGSDYVVCKTMMIESLPLANKAAVLGSMGIAWALGYALAYLVGFVLKGSPEAWRLILATGAAPAVLAIPLRFGTPESSLWLAKRQVRGAAFADALRTLVAAFHGPERQRVAFAAIMYGCLVMPYFAVSTFIPQVMSALHVQGSLSGGLIYTTCLALGAIAGTFGIAQVSRRAFALGAFLLTALALLGTLSFTASVSLVVCFAVFASALSAAQTLIFVFLPEMFSTARRAAGIGAAMAVGRIGAVLGTFLLPLCVRQFGVRVALAICVVVLLLGALATYLLAPETAPAGASTEPA